MTASIAVDDQAPNFDLSSTEDCLLMLQDEVPRTSVLLYFFSDGEEEQAQRDLAALSARRRLLAASHVKILGISPVKLAQLKELQASLRLRFPLLRDDRSFSEAYGVKVPEEGELAQPALFLVDRRQIVVWMMNPVVSIEDALGQVDKLVNTLDSPTANYPKSVINSLVDRWLN